MILEIKNDTSTLTVTIEGKGEFNEHEVRTVTDFIQAAQALRGRLPKSQNERAESGSSKGLSGRMAGIG